MRFFWRSVIVISVLVLIVIGTAYIYRGGFKRTVARAVTPDGIEMRVMQTQKWDDLPWLNTHFLYRKPGDVWKVCYYNHEDSFWWSCPVSLDTNNKVALFIRKGKKSRGSIRFNWTNESYTMMNAPLRSQAPWPQAPNWNP